ncbi:MAG: hypothetical protein MI757_22605, partial [Pirellulales bacterium]|nr:hypothetical protein [Pirellulales bacterium]
SERHIFDAKTQRRQDAGGTVRLRKHQKCEEHRRRSSMVFVCFGTILLAAKRNKIGRGHECQRPIVMFQIGGGYIT